MKIITSLFSILIITSTLMLSSCSPDNEDDVTPTLKEIDLSTTSTSTSIKLSWMPVTGCSWYVISYAKTGQALAEVANYQDLINTPITYTISGLTANTSYDLKIEGKDYASGGNLLATKSKTTSTLQ
jgi:hypothetical protein